MCVTLLTPADAVNLDVFEGLISKLADELGTIRYNFSWADPCGDRL